MDNGRVERQSANAHQIAQFLDAHSNVARVNYPGLADFPGHSLAKSQMSSFGAMLSFELDGFDEALVRAGGWVEYADAKY